jgi:hypothetical protein
VAPLIESSALRIGRFCKPIEFFYVSDRAKYFISFDSTYHQSKIYVSFFILFFSLPRKIVFTGGIAILGGIQRFSNSNKAFSRKLNTNSESAQKTESNEVSYKLI